MNTTIPQYPRWNDYLFALSSLCALAALALHCAGQAPTASVCAFVALIASLYRTHLQRNYCEKLLRDHRRR